MKLGDVIESAIWLTGEENPEKLRQYEHDVIQSIDDLCYEHGVIHGPVAFTEKRPGEDQVPGVPSHIQGIRVRLLVADTVIVSHALESSQGSFIGQLDKKDLDRLRAITRKIRLKLYKQSLTDTECDAIIEECGPEAAIETLRKQVRPFGMLH